MRLQTVSYRWKKNDDKVHTGYIAQQVEKIAPELVLEGQDGYKQVNYSGFIPSITGAIKELYQEFSSGMSDLKKENAEIRAENAELKTRIEALEKRLDSKL